MGLSSSFLKVCFLILLFAWYAQADPVNGAFSVKDFGAKADGTTDDAKAFVDAWTKACAWTGNGNPRVLIPQGTYYVSPVNFKGPCKSPGIGMQLEGSVKASPDQGTASWITFGYINGLSLSGNGQFDGQGSKTWSVNKCQNGGKCTYPINIRFDFITNGTVRGISSLNSKFFHINVLGCKAMKFQSLKISAPGESINTDGIHIGRSDGIEISNTVIGTGDDCISIGDGSTNLNISGIICGPGHGISIGSLGKYEKEDPVTGVTIRNCTLKNTMFGVRIKSWPASYPGTVSKLTFDDITMDNVSMPIIVDQEYCPYNKCNLQLPSQVKITDVTFSKIRGTSFTKETVKMVCSSSAPCQNVKLSDINLKYTGTNGTATATCKNAKVASTGQVAPAVCV